MAACFRRLHRNSDCQPDSPTAATAATAATSIAASASTPTAAPSATSGSASSDLADKIHRKLEKKLGHKHGIIIDGVTKMKTRSSTNAQFSGDSNRGDRVLSIFGAPVRS
jgi:hypothetical protein